MVSNKTRHQLSTEAIVGKKRKGPHTSANSEHGRASRFRLIAPNGIVYKGKNITNFVRNNKQLFLKQDTIVKRYIESTNPKAIGREACNASFGLNRINRGFRMQWKGWRRT